MRLTLPLDLDILEALSDGKRNMAANLAYSLDKDRAYLGNRLLRLNEQGLVDRVGPAPQSGLYEITDAGAVLAEHGEECRAEDGAVEALLDAHLEGR